MEYPIRIILFVLISIAVAYFIYSSQKKKIDKLKAKLEKTSENKDELEEASDKSKKILTKAKNDALEIREQAEKQAKKSIKLLEEREENLNKREKSILERSQNLDKRYTQLEKQEEIIEKTKLELKKNKEIADKKLEEIANLTKEEAKQNIIDKLNEELTNEVASKIKEAENRIEIEVDEKAKDLLVDTMQRSATDYVVETTSTTFEIEKEELKGKIIGKDGRNIRTFERLTGVDIIVDEAPNQITVSSFDPIRREVAALAIQKLLKDGRVHPGTIEATIQGIKEDIAKEIRKTGEKIAYESGFNNLPIEIIKLLGRFKYRFSYGQNLVKHTLEMVNIGQQLAQEINIDVQLTKKACLLHDIGKVLTHEIEGKPHHHISGDIVRKYLKDEKLAHAVEAHHEDIKPQTKEAIIVMIADKISSVRPGARKSNYEDYIQRVRALEDIATDFKEVKQAYAIHAGREVRVIVNPKEADDSKCQILAHKIAQKIEKTQNYPGTVKVNVIRETRFEEEAK